MQCAGAEQKTVYFIYYLVFTPSTIKVIPGRENLFLFKEKRKKEKDFFWLGTDSKLLKAGWVCNSNMVPRDSD